MNRTRTLLGALGTLVLLACLPLLALPVPGVLPGYTYEPGSSSSWPCAG
nr:hypothetical protein GCM10025730_20210 [Promicromonospora thailandica]